MLRSKIIGVGAYLPSNVVTNDDLSKMMDTDDEWITQRTGIKERRWTTGESNSDLALQASTQAIKNSGIAKEDIDFIIVATLSPDHDFPGVSCFLQAKLEMPGVPTLDIRQQCTGFVYAASIADTYIKSGTYKNILVVGSEIHSVGLDKTTKGRDTAVLFGDGAGAVVMTATEVQDNTQSQFFPSVLHADGQFAKELYVPAPGTAVGPDRINKDMIDEGMQFPIMNGKKVYVHAIKNMVTVTKKVIEDNGFTLEDVDVYLFHQANLRIIEAIGTKLNLPTEKVYNTIQKYGNTTAGTIPIGLHHALEDGTIKPGTLVCSIAFGSGFTWGANLFRY